MVMRRLLSIAIVSIITTSCGSSGTDMASEPVTSPSVVTTDPPLAIPDIAWKRCAATKAECAVIEVPFDYERPEIGSFDLPLARHLARVPADRIGVLFTNAGGPGSESRWLAEDADYYFSEVILDRFDIVAWDPRGTGGARPELDCVDDMDPYFGLDPSPDLDEETEVLLRAAGEFVSSCQERSGDILPYISTESTARDIDFIRRALGEDTASFLGFSYGSELGAVWATMFPDTVRAAVLDAAADPDLDLIDWLTLQSSGFERMLEAFFADCDLHGCSYSDADETAAMAFDRIMLEIDSAPQRVSADRPEIGQGFALIAVFSSLYSDDTWAELDSALAEADNFTPDRLVTLYDGYFGGYRDGHADDSMDSYIAITCLDRDEDFSTDDAFEAMIEVNRVSPRLGASVLQELLLCALWPVAPHPSPDVEWSGDVPILVLGSTGDSATPLEGTRRMVESLGNAMLVIVDSFDHTSYGLDSCATEIVDDYLVDLITFDVDKTCE